MKIAVVGLWHSGEIYSACLAELGNTVFGIDTDQTIVDNLNVGIPPLKEIEIEELLEKNLRKNSLQYSSQFEIIKGCDIVWMTVDTPLDKGAHGSTKKLFLYLTKTLPHIKQNSLLVISSQLPAGTSAKIQDFISKKRSDLVYTYAYVPENLRIGAGVQAFLKASRVVIGTESTEAKSMLTKIFKRVTSNIITVSVPSAEMIKHATNAFLATSMSFIYDISDICEQVGADVTEVSKGLRADSRIGSEAYLDASCGYSGGHLERDLKFLKKIAKNAQIKTPVINAVESKNKKRSEIILNKLLPIIGSLDKKKVTFFGITYKSGTPTLEHSLPLRVAKSIYAHGASIVLNDPWVEKSTIQKNMSTNIYHYETDPYISINNSDIVICITPWPELKMLDFKKIAKKMHGQKIFFDARNYFSSERESIAEAGMQYVGVGRS